MSRVEAVAAMDRLPWLPDEPKPLPARREHRNIAGWAAAAILLVAGAGFWMGANSFEVFPVPAADRAQPTATVRLPEARPAVPVQPQVKLTRAPEVEPMVAQPMPVVDEPPPMIRAPVKAVAAEQAPNPAQVDPLHPWPVRVIDGAAGRLVRIGAFASAHKAKRGWWAIVRSNPALERLPALVVPVRSFRTGRVYYRLQMGTSSQAHSAVLCQRMRMIAKTCVVIGAGEGPNQGGAR
ncbi:MAG: hypothetical protein QOK41_1587 [Sphingomonadales bacterium]|nr:hypothetical protein [Sphingomonadales bacterium]